MEQRLVAFFDLLGFSSIIRPHDDMNVKKQDKILALLSELSENSGDFSYRADAVDEATTDHIIKPAISAFSDNIVYSFPLHSIAPVGSGPITSYLADQAGAIFRQALELGCLIRGGITVGQLHHDKQVIFGPALVEAYELESRYAKTPRIIISDAAMDFIERHPFVQFDDDGYAILDYVQAVFHDAIRIGRTKKDDDFAPGWWRHVDKTIVTEIGTLKTSNNLSGLQNWRWTQ
jgi:hypothetical protein